MLERARGRGVYINDHELFKSFKAGAFFPCWGHAAGLPGQGEAAPQLRSEDVSLKCWPSAGPCQENTWDQECVTRTKQVQTCTGRPRSSHECGLGSKYKCLGLSKSMCFTCRNRAEDLQEDSLNVAQDESKAVQLHAELEELIM